MAKINRVEIDGDMVVIVRGNIGYVYNSKLYRVKYIESLISCWTLDERELYFHSVSGEKSTIGKVKFYKNPNENISDKEIYYVRGNIRRNVIAEKANKYPDYIELEKLLYLDRQIID